MRTITLEEHFTIPAVIDAHQTRHPAGIAKPPFFKRIMESLLDLGQDRIAAMDRDGVDHQVLSLTGGGLTYFDKGLARELALEGNRVAAEAAAKYPQRLSAFASLPMLEPELAAQELETCVRRHGFKGGFIEGTVNGEFLDHPRFLPVFEAAQALDVPIYLHPSPPPAAVQQAYFGNLEPPFDHLLATAGWGWHAEVGMHCLRMMMAGLFDRLPRLKILIGHLGENLPFSIARAQFILSRGPLKTKRTLEDYFRENFWLTSAGYFTLPPLECARQIVGIDRVLYSVDYPFAGMDTGRQFLESLPAHFSPEEMEKIAWRNAAEILCMA